MVIASSLYVLWKASYECSTFRYWGIPASVYQEIVGVTCQVSQLPSSI